MCSEQQNRLLRTRWSFPVVASAVGISVLSISIASAQLHNRGQKEEGVTALTMVEHSPHKVGTAADKKIAVMHEPLERVDTTVTITTVGSELAFRPSQLTLKQGTRVRLRYVNEGTMPHNLLLIRDRSKVDMIGVAALNAAATGFIPVEHTNDLLGYTKLAYPGDTVEFTFTVPAPGEYPFACTFPGHFRVMQGVLRSTR